MQPLKLGVLASGRGTNLQSIIDTIQSGNLSAKISVIFSDKPEAQALERGRLAGIPTATLPPADYKNKAEYNRAVIELLKSYDIDLICLAGYMRILTDEFIQAFKGNVINIHPSLLPAFPGLNVQQKALDFGVKIAGCTVHYVEEQVDSGPIILQASVPVLDTDDVQSLSERILEQEHIIYPQAIQMIAENRITLSGRRTLIKENQI